MYGTKQIYIRFEKNWQSNSDLFFEINQKQE